MHQNISMLVAYFFSFLSLLFFDKVLKIYLLFQGPLFQKREKIRDFFRFCIVGDAIKEIVITYMYIILKVFHDHWRPLDPLFTAYVQPRFEFQDVQPFYCTIWIGVNSSE